MTDVNQLITDHLDVWTAAIEKKSSAGRGSGGAVSPYGIKKLRELILELALAGKLVEQRLSEGMGSDLVSDAIRQKAKLQTNGARKTNANQGLGSEATSKALPRQWGAASLGDVCEIIRGITFSAKDKHDGPAPGLVACLRTSNVQEQIETDDLIFVDPKFIKKDAQRLRQNDIVISMANSRALVGKVAFYKGDLDDEPTFGGFLAVIRPVVILPKFLMCYLRASSTREEMIAGASQTTNIANISLAKLNPMLLPVPPLEEQHRIVAKVDELMALCDALERQAKDSLKAHQTLVETCLATLTNSQSSEELTQNWTRIEAHFDTLFTTEESVEALRRAVLDLALRGLLTDQSDNTAPASVLLRELYTKNKKSASSRHRTIVSKIKESEPPFDLPASWAWSNLGLLSSDLRYGTSKKCGRDDSLVPVLRIPNVSGGRVDLADMKYGPLEPKEVADLRLRSNDLLIIRSNGSLDIVGSFAVVPELEGDFAFAGYLVRVRIDPAYVDPRYIWYVSKSRFLRDQIEGPIRHGVGLKNVNSTELASLQFPIPPREEQERIVDKLDGLFELCDQFTLRIRDRNTINVSLADTLTSKIH